MVTLIWTIVLTTPAFAYGWVAPLRGIEPRSSPYEGAALPLSYNGAGQQLASLGMVGAAGLEPATSRSRSGRSAD